MTVRQARAALLFTLLSFAVLHGIVFWRFHDFIFRGYGDFASFYTAAKIVQHGQNSRLYDRGLQWNLQQEFAPSVDIRTAPLPYIRPPFEALLFLPFAYLQYRNAFIVWTALKLAILFAVPFVLAGHTQTELLPSPVLQGLLCLGFFPVAFDLIQGQDSILLLALVSLFFTSLSRGLEFRSGLYLGLGLFKFHLILPLFAVVALRRKGKAVAGFVAAALILFSLSVVLVGWPALARYPQYLWGLKQAPWLAGMRAETMPNIRGLLTPILGRGPLPLITQAILAALSVAGILLAARYWQIDDADISPAEFAFTLVTVLVTSFYLNSYDLCLLIVPLLCSPRILARHPEVRGWSRNGMMVCSALLLFSPLHWILALHLDQYYWTALIQLGLAVALAGLISVLVRKKARMLAGQIVQK